jgi:hypothetical protein
MDEIADDVLAHGINVRIALILSFHHKHTLSRSTNPRYFQSPHSNYTTKFHRPFRRGNIPMELELSKCRLTTPRSTFRKTLDITEPMWEQLSAQGLIEVKVARNGRQRTNILTVATSGAA